MKSIEILFEMVYNIYEKITKGFTPKGQFMETGKYDNLAPYLFHQGTNYKTYEYLGAHRENGETVFRTWAPKADAVYVVGDFNGWTDETPMKKITDGGIWEARIGCSAFGDYSVYKYKIRNADKDYYKADPYAYHTETPPDTASKFYDIEGYDWQDGGWMEQRRKNGGDFYARPMNIYELHLLSWKKKEGDFPLTYRELAEELPSYVKQMGYTHVEMMPVMEHPFDGSWGYQVCGYYAPTSRLGTPKDFMYLIDRLHCAGIGVILDWVPAHFPKDAHGLYEFDGTPTYEYQGWDKMEHKSWGTRRFDVGRNEVECFLISNADFWLRKYHADGLRVDAVASMLYLDYDKKPGEWFPSSRGDNKCLEAISFFRMLNSYINKEFPDALMIAEESTAWENVTRFDDRDGLGFKLKWNMGWMNDTLTYAGMDPYFRQHNHSKITFSMLYAFSEKYILPISHDEVVHGKRSFLDKMPGTYEQKFAGARTFMAYIIGHPGKKLTFMGSEIGQFTEWNEKAQCEWFLLDYDLHAKFQSYVAELNHLYAKHPELWENDDSWEGFQWIDADNASESVLSFRRIAKNGDELIFVLNLTPVARERFNMGVPQKGTYAELLSSDEERFGGSGATNGRVKSFVCNGYRENGFENAIEIKLPPLSAVILKREGDKAKKRKS